MWIFFSEGLGGTTWRNYVISIALHIFFAHQSGNTRQTLYYYTLKCVPWQQNNNNKKSLRCRRKKNKNGHLFPVLCRPLQAQSDIATNGHNRRWEWTNPSRASSSAMRLHRESLLVGADTICCSPNGESLTWRKDVLIRSPVEWALPPQRIPPCVTAGNGSGIRCGVWGQFDLPDRTRAEVLLRSPRSVPGWRSGKAVVQQSGGAVQGVSAASRIPA